MRSCVIVVAMVLACSVGLAAYGECAEASTWWYYVDIITGEAPGSWAMWWHGGPVCMDGYAIY